jgi:protocatechuate 3,4-dioxygenase beta subunit
MKSYFPILLLLCTSVHSLSQPDTAGLMKQVRSQLSDHKSTVSSILTDKSYISVHPFTSFRELIRINATNDILRIAPDDEPGKKIRVIATITDRNNQPIPNALVYLYQTDSKGWYAADAPHVLQNEGDMRHARLFGYVKTDKNGKFELNTVKPSGYPQSDLPAHIHVHVWADGYRTNVTEFLFKDDDRLKGEILNRAIVDGGLIGVPEKAEAPFEQKFSYVIRLINL